MSSNYLSAKKLIKSSFMFLFLFLISLNFSYAQLLGNDFADPLVTVHRLWVPPNKAIYLNGLLKIVYPKEGPVIKVFINGERFNFESTDIYDTIENHSYFCLHKLIAVDFPRESFCFLILNFDLGGASYQVEEYAFVFKLKENELIYLMKLKTFMGSHFSAGRTDYYYGDFLVKKNRDKNEFGFDFYSLWQPDDVLGPSYFGFGKSSYLLNKKAELIRVFQKSYEVVKDEYFKIEDAVKKIDKDFFPMLDETLDVFYNKRSLSIENVKLIREKNSHIKDIRKVKDFMLNRIKNKN